MPTLSRFKTDQSLEKSGIWVDVGEGLEFLIARQGTPRFDEEVTRLTSGTAGLQMRHSILDNEHAESMLRTAIARTCLLDWRNLQDDNGREIPYSVEKSEEILRDYPDLYRFVHAVSGDAAMYRDRAVEKQAGNSETPSDG